MRADQCGTDWHAGIEQRWFATSPWTGAIADLCSIDDDTDCAGAGEPDGSGCGEDLGLIIWGYTDAWRGGCGHCPEA